MRRLAIVQKILIMKRWTLWNVLNWIKLFQTHMTVMCIITLDDFKISSMFLSPKSPIFSWNGTKWVGQILKKKCETFCASTFLISVDYVSRNETSRSWSAHLSRINDVKHGSIQNKLHIMLVSQTNVVSQIHTHKSERAFILLKPSRHGSL